jgi:hypothetical protein
MTGIVVLLLAAGCGGSSGPQGSALPESGRILDEHLDTAHLIITLHPTPSGVTDPGPGLRSIDLHAEDGLREPHGRWPDGSPVSADALVPAEQMRPGFFDRAARCYTQRVASPTAPPPQGSTPGIPPRPLEPNVVIEVHVNDDEYYHYFIDSHPTGEAGRAELQAIAGAVSGPAAELVSSLASQL